MTEDQKLNRIQSILNDLATPQGSESYNIPFRLATHWTTIVGKELLSLTAPLAYSGSTLTIGVRDPALLFQCQTQAQDWIQKLNQFLGSRKVEKVRFKLI